MEQVWELRDSLLAGGDPRTNNYLLVRDPLSHLLVIGLYLTFVIKHVGTFKSTPTWVKPTLLLYDLIQVCLSLFIALELVICCMHTGYSVLCQTVDTSMDPVAVRIANAMWWAFMSKIVDLLDTVFIILKNKTQQVSFLHVYHHSTMIFNAWLGCKFGPGGQGIFCAVINSCIHVIMYSYYFLSGLGPHMQKYLWWKRYLTQIQIIQFVAVSSHFIYGSVTECAFPRWLQLWGAGYCGTLIILFSNFYLKAYITRSKSTSGKQLQMNGHSGKVLQQNGFTKSNISMVKNGYTKPQKID